MTGGPGRPAPGAGGAPLAAVVHLAAAGDADVPSDQAWLTDSESRVHAAFHVPNRARDWRLGRWVAKEAVAAALELDGAPIEEIEILGSPGGAPFARVLFGRDTPPVTVSLSHSGGVGFAAAAAGAVRLGCDVETVEARSPAFVADYFTEAEARWIEAGGALRDLRANLLWSAKESALKALGEGLRLDTRSVEVEAVEPCEEACADEGRWRRLAVAIPGGATFAGLWRVLDGRAWTVVAEGPILLA